jgi:hypothetical protein
MQQRGESLSSIATLADTTAVVVRALLKFAPPESADTSAAVGAAAAGGASDALGLDVAGQPGGDVGPHA